LPHRCRFDRDEATGQGEWFASGGSVRLEDRDAKGPFSFEAYIDRIPPAAL
jgi:hypothetical protein